MESTNQPEVTTPNKPEPAKPPNPVDVIDGKIGACVQMVGRLHTQRRRLAATLATIDAQIAAHEADLDSLDKVRQVLS